MTIHLRGISSMATRQVLADLATQFTQRTGATVAIESVGGVDAAKRVAAGETFDFVALASDAIDKLIAAGHVAPGSRVDLVRSEVAMAVRHGAPHPDVSSEAALRQAVEAAPSVGYSTGPSGVALAALFERWGIKPHIVQAPAGVPVGSLVARGDVALGFQQLSELIHIKDIDLLGVLPAPVSIVTVFSGGLCKTATQPEAVRALFDFMTSSAAFEAKRLQGMAPA